MLVIFMLLSSVLGILMVACVSGVHSLSIKGTHAFVTSVRASVHHVRCAETRLYATRKGLSERANRILDSCNGDINMATQMVFQEDGETTTDERARMWNAVAEYLPLSESEATSPRVAKKLQTIADVCVQTKDKKKQGRVLDVGCGNGLIIPMLKKSGLQLAKNYVGLDLSNVMVEQLRQKYSNVDAHVCDFMEWKKEGEQFETVLLNGVLQYNSNPMELVRKAASLSTKLIVMSHYRGLAFIEEEKLKMPGRIWDLPTRDSLLELEGWVLDEKYSRADHECKDFNLLALRKVGS